MIGVRLKEERERLGLTQPAFAEIAGAKKRTLIDWEQGVSSPTAVQLAALSAAGVDAIYVLNGERNIWLDDPVPTKDSPTILTSDHLDKLKSGLEKAALQAALKDFVLVPRYEVQASAGSGTLIHSEQIVDYLAFKADWVRNTLGVAQKDLALISVKGDSMEPVLSNEDLILVDMRKNRVEDNAIYVLRLNGSLLVKRIQHKLDGSLCVMSDNPRYEAEVVSADRSGDLNVLGRVVWSGRRM